MYAVFWVGQKSLYFFVFSSENEKMQLNWQKFRNHASAFFGFKGIFRSAISLFFHFICSFCIDSERTLNVHSTVNGETMNDFFKFSPFWTKIST